MLNKVTLIGNVGDVPEVRSLQSGDAVANFSLATSKSWKDKTTGEKKESTEWHRVSVFGDGLVNNVIAQYVDKGTKLYVEGELRTRKWQDKDGNDQYTTEVVVSGMAGKIILLSPRNTSAPKSVGDNVVAYNRGQANVPNDEIPF